MTVTVKQVTMTTSNEYGADNSTTDYQLASSDQYEMQTVARFLNQHKNEILNPNMFKLHLLADSLHDHWALVELSYVLPGTVNNFFPYAERLTRLMALMERAFVLVETTEGKAVYVRVLDFTGGALTLNDLDNLEPHESYQANRDRPDGRLSVAR